MHPDERKLFKRVGLGALVGAGIIAIVLIRAIFLPVERAGAVDITVTQGESVQALSERLASEGVITSAYFFRQYVSLRGIDKKIQVGTFHVEPPLTMPRVASALLVEQRKEQEITILPGWTIRDIARYLEQEGYGSEEEAYALLGRPAYDYRPGSFISALNDVDIRVLSEKPSYISFEGYLAPETFRVYADATVQDVIMKLLLHREQQITADMYQTITRQGRTWFEVLTIASIVEREVQRPEDKAIVADIFWRRYDERWAFQADSTVHYIKGDADSVFTSAADRAVDNAWNTYKYPGLPLGPISNPSLATIEAVIMPKKNAYSYFLTDSVGTVHYARTLEEHNANRAAYLQ